MKHIIDRLEATTLISNGLAHKFTWFSGAYSPKTKSFAAHITFKKGGNKSTLQGAGLTLEDAVAAALEGIEVSVATSPVNGNHVVNLADASDPRLSPTRV